VGRAETAIGKGQAPLEITPGYGRSLRCLLDIDHDLADELELPVLPAARAAALALTIETDPGRLPLPEWLKLASGGPGVLVLDGVLAVNVRVGDRVATELLGSGDLIQPAARDEELLTCEVDWRALVPSRFALLDLDFAKRVRFWPQINQALLRRSARRIVGLNVQRAIAAQPRLEARLSLLLWHLASRWGKVERGGIRLPLPLTHHLIGHLIGAERPSVSHALARLAQAGLITGHGDEWHLHGRLEEHLEAIADHGRHRVDGLVFGAGFAGAERRTAFSA
jgi:CRP/FNR family transcriptional regulator, cyclic AMP receptor protein